VSRRVDSARELSTRSSAESDLIGGFLCVIPGDASLDQLLRDPRQLPRVTIGIPLVGTGSNRANAPVPYKVNFAVLDGPAGVLACGHRRMQAVGDLGVADANLRADVRTEELLTAPSLGDEKATADVEGSLDHTDRRSEYRGFVNPTWRQPIRALSSHFSKPL